MLILCVYENRVFNILETEPWPSLEVNENVGMKGRCEIGTLVDIGS